MERVVDKQLRTNRHRDNKKAWTEKRDVREEKKSSWYEKTKYNKFSLNTTFKAKTLKVKTDQQNFISFAFSVKSLIVELEPKMLMTDLLIHLQTDGRVYGRSEL